MYWNPSGVSVMAYFTDPMSDEFKKAIEEAMKELEEGSNKETQTSKKRRRHIKHISTKSKRALR